MYRPSVETAGRSNEPRSAASPEGELDSMVVADSSLEAPAAATVGRSPCDGRTGAGWLDDPPRSSGDADDHSKCRSFAGDGCELPPSASSNNDAATASGPSARATL